MERDVYARMAEIEAHHWWFVARRAILTEVLLRLVDLSPPARILEAGCFDLVAAFEVLEHVDDDLSSLRALGDQLRPGGTMLIMVPAFDFLWSRHDERHHHERRYVRAGLRRRASDAGLTPVEVTYFNG